MSEKSIAGLVANPPSETTTRNENIRHNGISIVIRARNEVEDLRRLLDILDKQTVKPQEVIVVDNESTDGTRELALARGARVVELPKDEFTYPRSMNLGVQNASGEFVALMTAHSFPIHNDWLERGTMYFQEPEVAGVYAGTIPRTDTSKTDRVLAPFFKLASKRWQTRIEDKMGHSILGATNCIIRRSLWEKRPFSKDFGAGGEDSDWAKWALGEGYSIINDNHFMVDHSHGLGPLGWARQIREWRGMSKAKPFSRRAISYRRKDL